MNTFRKYLLALMLTATAINVLPHRGSGFGAGIATGAILGTGLAAAATRDGYYDYPVIYDDYPYGYYRYGYYPYRYHHHRHYSRPVVTTTVKK